MSYMKRRNLQPGGRKHRNTKTVDGKKDHVDDTPENSVIMNGHDSHHWQVRLDEAPSFSDVTVYDARGRVMKVIAREQLLRPWQERHNNTWNNCLFAKRISDKV